MRPMTMRHIARALHTFGTQKQPLHVIHEKKIEKKKMIPGLQEFVVPPFPFFAFFFFVAYNLCLSLHFSKRCIKEMTEVTTQARLRGYSHEPSGALADAAHGE